MKNLQGNYFIFIMLWFTFDQLQPGPTVSKKKRSSPPPPPGGRKSGRPPPPAPSAPKLPEEAPDEKSDENENEGLYEPLSMHEEDVVLRAVQMLKLTASSKVI